MKLVLVSFMLFYFSYMCINAPINDKPHPPHLGRGGGYVGLRSYNLCPVVGESPIDCLGVKVQLL